MCIGAWAMESFCENFGNGGVGPSFSPPIQVYPLHVSRGTKAWGGCGMWVNLGGGWVLGEGGPDHSLGFGVLLGMPG